MRGGLVFLPVVLLAGCATWGGNLDRAQFEAHQSFYVANGLFAKAVGVYRTGAAKMADQKHDIQGQYDKYQWDQWLARHTSADGGLVARNDKGEIVPLPVVDLVKVLDERDTRAGLLLASRGNWAKYETTMDGAVCAFEALNTKMQAKDIVWQEAKESAKAFLDSALTTLVSLAAGIGTGAAVAP